MKEDLGLSIDAEGFEKASIVCFGIARKMYDVMQTKRKARVIFDIDPSKEPRKVRMDVIYDDNLQE